MKQPKGLGRGLEALISGYGETSNINTSSDISIINVKIEKIIPNEKQPRKDFDEEKILELADSIKTHGVIQPLILSETGDYYKIVAGERRFRAAIIAGLDEVPSIVRKFTESEMTQIALVENIQREDLNDIEEAYGYRELRDSFNMSQEEISTTVGKSRAAVANSLRLLQLSDLIQNMLASKLISAGHARAVLALENHYLRESFAQYIVDNELTVRDAEKLSKTYTENISIDKPATIEKVKEPHFMELEEKLSARFATKVAIKESRKKDTGKIELEYYCVDDFERIMELLIEPKGNESLSFL
ncbi:MAG: ParB/RepB/Spo0J family partition protein [Eubacteriaceae bacterium]|nr:ParB/RepB/Spo0J family partition protein [Eubacteriaceae bacterium]